MSKEINTTILIVGNNSTRASYLIHLFKEYHLKAVYTESGKNALEMLKSSIFNLVLIDEKVVDVEIDFFCKEIRDNPIISKTVIVLLAEKNDVGYRTKAMSAGIDGYLLRPIDNDELIKQISSLLGQEKFEMSHEQTNRKSKVLVFTSSKGGTGVTTLTSNLGMLLSKVYNKKTLLVDASGYTNQLAGLLGVQISKNLSDVCSLPSSLMEENLNESITKINNNLHLLNLVSNIEDFSKITIATLEWAFNNFSNIYDFILIDVKPGFLGDLSMFFLRYADDLNLLTTYEPLAMRDTKNFITLLRNFGVPDQKIKLIINRADCEIGKLDPDLIHKNLNYGVFCTLPNDWHACIESADKQIPVMEYAPKSKYAKEIKVLADYYNK